MTPRACLTRIPRFQGLVRSDSAGHSRAAWVSRYNDPANGWDYATAVAVSQDGATVFVTGWVYGRKIDDRAAVAYRS